MAVISRFLSRAPSLANISEGVQQEAVDLEAGLSAAEQQSAQEAAEALRQVVFKGSGGGTAHVELAELLEELCSDLSKVDALRKSKGLAPLDETERQARAIFTISRYLFRNEKPGATARWLGNLTSSGVRTGLATFMATMARNLGAFAMQQCLNYADALAQEGQIAAANPATQPVSEGSNPPYSALCASTEGATTLANIFGGLMLGTMASLHLVGALRDLRSGAANFESLLSRYGQVSLDALLIAIAINNSSWESLPSWLTAAGIYSAGRGVSSALLERKTNVGEYSPPALALAAASYSVAQFGGTMAQNALGLWGGATADSIRTADRYTEARRSALEITEGRHPWGANAGHAALNASLEVFDELQYLAVNRAFQSAKAKRQLRTILSTKDTTPQTRIARLEEISQMHAAALRGMIDYARINPDASNEALEAAGANAVREYRNAKLEGVRMSLARTPASERMLEERANRALIELASLGYRFTPEAPADGPGKASKHNRLIAAYVAQSLEKLKQDQPLEISTLSTCAGWQRLGGRLVNQFLNVEPYRQSLLHALYSALSLLSLRVRKEQVPNDKQRVLGVNNAVEASWTAGLTLLLYPQLKRGVQSRQEPEAQRETAARRKARMDELALDIAQIADLADAVRQPGSWERITEDLASKAVANAVGRPIRIRHNMQRNERTMLARERGAQSPVEIVNDGAGYRGIVENQIRETQPDGDSFFRAVLMNMHQNADVPDHAIADLRQRTSQELLNNARDYVQFLTPPSARTP
ncbi:hypothetical protein [Chelativorans sp. Marseille-P2723]|uniref:hypothetical protein n=1 Tax=Chelativorans sp. Marseille-P2723 TaxID=2709133 RepID=UPI00156FF6E3|nr:hypothetical protein [Chelativorans sp. Marseille-P2723]